MWLFYNWNDLRNELYWRDVNVATRILRYALPRIPCEKGEIAIAGSAALHWYQEKQNIGPKWDDPGDIDIFVAGVFGKNKLRFQTFVMAVLHKIQKTGHDIMWYAMIKHPYAIRNQSIWIFNFQIRGNNLIFSFVQSPKCQDINDTLAGFDIDVCKVAFKIHSETFIIAKETHQNILHHNAVAENTIFSCNGPDNFDEKQVLSTLKRIRKYTKRGFHFPGSGGITYSTDT